MDTVFPVFFVFIVSIVFYAIYRKAVIRKRTSFINHYKFPESIKNRVAKVYPHLENDQLDQVMRGLRDYFHLVSVSKRQSVAMPSQVVDVAWHEFILFTKEYSIFCSKALGRFLHHTPVEAMKSKNEAQSGIKRAWRIACYREQINPFAPNRLPVIFVLDSRLKIEDGFHYELNCMKSPTSSLAGGNPDSGYCGSHIGCSSGCAGSAGDGGCSGGSGGGGCGGD